MAFVLDSSVALAWVMPDEGDEATDALLDLLEDSPAVVPSVWVLEVGNALLVAERRGRLQPADPPALAKALAALPLDTDRDGPSGGLEEILALARETRLTTYDAAYLELAARRVLALATLDERLREAAVDLRIPVLP